MADSVINYPGGKTYLCLWVIDHFPAHEHYVEAFGGSAAVLLNKPPSRVEVYNDRDGDVVHFFRVLRERSDELVEWCRARPFSKDLHERYSRQYYAGYRPDDDIERAGRFFYLRRSQFAAKYDGYSGFRSASETNHAQAYATSAADLERFADRLRNVQIENRDYRDLFDRFDSPEVFWYLDPPYIQEGDGLYTGGPFDHATFVEHVRQLEGRWCISYTDVPEPLQDFHIAERQSTQHMRKGQSDTKRTERIERLVMNYDPDAVPSFRQPGQTGLEAFTDGGASDD